MRRRSLPPRHDPASPCWSPPRRQSPPSAHRATRRDAVVDRLRQQPHHAHARGLQRAPGGRQVVLGSTVKVPTAAEGAAALQAAGRQPAGVAPRPRPPRAAAAPRGAPAGWLLRRPRGDTLSGLAATARVPIAQMAAVNGLDPPAPLLTGTVLKLPTGAPTPGARLRAAAGAARRARGRPGPTPPRVGAGDIQSVAAAARRPALAGRRDRLAGERLQQRDGLRRQRPRRDAGHARHVELRAAEPRRRQLDPTPRPTTCTPA